MARDRRGRHTAAMQTEPIHPAVRVGHVHLRVADLDRAIAFYRDALGFGVSADARAIGLRHAFLAAGDYHHHIGLNTFESAGAAPPPPGHTGLYHVAFLYPDRRELGRAVRRLLDHGHRGRPRHRPRRHGLGLPRRPGRQRRRALLRPPARRVVRRRRAGPCSRTSASTPRELLDRRSGLARLVPAPSSPEGVPMSCPHRRLRSALASCPGRRAARARPRPAAAPTATATQPAASGSSCTATTPSTDGPCGPGGCPLALDRRRFRGTRRHRRLQRRPQARGRRGVPERRGRRLRARSAAASCSAPARRTGSCSPSTATPARTAPDP